MQATAAADRIEVRSSRWWAFFHFNLTWLIFPPRLIADHIGVSTNIVRFWLTPWRRTDEHLPLSHVAEVIHIRGLIWDAVSVESSGGTQSAAGKRPAKIAGPLLRRACARAAEPKPGRDAAAIIRHCQTTRRRLFSRDYGDEDYAAAAATSSPLNLSPCLLAVMTTVSPSLRRPDRIISASGSCTDFWITRFSGRAP